VERPLGRQGIEHLALVGVGPHVKLRQCITHTISAQ
jgi:hypothetical protein